jgi:hypothetical protein
LWPLTAGDDLDIAVFAVTYPATEAVLLRDRHSRGAEKYTLHLSAHTPVYADNFTFLRHGS